MADEKVISQLKERVAFLEGLVMSLVAKNGPSANPAVAQANTNSVNYVQPVPATIDKTSEERVAFLKKLVMSLVAKNEPSADPVATRVNNSLADNVQTESSVTNGVFEQQVPGLMRLPPELRLTILELVPYPVFADSPYGLISPLPFPVTIHTNKTRFPAVLHVNHIMRVESMKFYLDRAQKMIVDLEFQNKRIYQEHLVYRKLNPTTGNWHGPLYGLESQSRQNFLVVKSLVSLCKAAKGAFGKTEAAEPSHGRDS